MTELIKIQEAVCERAKGGCGIDIIRRVRIDLNDPILTPLAFCPKCKRPVLFADQVPGKSNWPENYEFIK